MFFKKKSERRTAPQTVQLSESIQCDVFTGLRDDGTRRIDFALSRVNPQPGGRSFRTFRYRDAVQLPGGLAVLFSALSKVPDQPAELREQLAHMSGLLEQVASVGQLAPLNAVNGHAIEEAGEPRIFG